MTRLLRFWLTGTYPEDKISGVRGQVVDSDQLYEIAQKDGKWQAFEWITHEFDDGWGYRPVGEPGDLFSALAAAEADAQEAQKAAAELEAQQENEDHH